MFGRGFRSGGFGLSPRVGITAALAALLVLLVMGLPGCSKKKAQIETAPAPKEQPTAKEPVKVPASPEIPVAPAKPVQPAPEQNLGMKPIFFDYDKYDIKPEAREVLNANGRILKDKSGARIVIEGHCDERGTVQYNMALGEKRARAARDYLVDLGIDASRIEIVSYGKERPFMQGHDESSWWQNRRAHFVAR
jgi:peptidoglycan-associated lipoprotein